VRFNICLALAKSAFHEFLSDVLELVGDRGEIRGEPDKQVIWTVIRTFLVLFCITDHFHRYGPEPCNCYFLKLPNIVFTAPKISAM